MSQAIDTRLDARAALALAAVMALIGCERRPAASPPAPPAAAPAAAPAPLPSPPTLGRAELLQAIAAARAAYAAGQTNAADSLAGRSFAIREAFGCAGPTDTAREGRARWAWDARRQAIEISLTPADWTTAPVLAGTAVGPAGAGRWEAVEGFWLTRPWLLTDGCPAPPINPVPAAGGTPPKVAATPPVAGLAAVFEAEGSRVGRRDGRAYAFTLRGDPAPELPIGGYRLLIEGRFSAFPDGQAVRCATPDPDAEPVCVAAAEIDRVAFEDASGKLLREWRGG